ncbi:MAG: NAD(P)/FAD-dependent oxidoreductase [Anaerolineae bacterium]|jgi:cation diffusion facilitator CzcD-associated flavoprotein CzcO|nr:NAD(P)/FAD-dependent oxidoreductase [Anaerolineae bacterium]
METLHFDVVIVGAGLSGIGAAYYVQTECPRKSYTVLEARDAIGGTWDLFRYPGVRSDSDMYTLGYRFHPWRDPKAIADGPAILSYIRETAQTYGIDRHIRFRHKLIHAEWSSETMRWTLQVATDAGVQAIVCQFLYSCGGYYDYDQGYTPTWPGMERFQGQIIHPQQWPTDLDYTGKRVIVIGSGATAVTLVPAMTDRAEHVTMLQRSPTYIFSMPSEDTFANTIRRLLPEQAAYVVARWRAILFTIYSYFMARRFPQTVKKSLLQAIRDQLGPGFEVEKHFSPTYNPWDQRLCLVPDGDLFNVIKAGKASIVTDEIETFTERGICLKSGEELPADIIVTATGLVMRLMKGVTMIVDGRTIELNQLMSYKGMMLSDVPNLAFAIGYTNASWTLKCELTSQYVCRLLNYMDQQGYAYAVPRQHDPEVLPEPVINFNSGYVLRAMDSLPKQGSKPPWKLYQNYILDLMTLKHGQLADGTIEFGRAR